MPKVMIEMEMPKKCEDCDFLTTMRDCDDELYEYPYCPYLANEVDTSKRPPECPLQEVKE